LKSQEQARERLEIDFPSDLSYEQDEEWCEVRAYGTRRRIRFHDYHEIYAIPGLYEQLFYEKLKCDSPRVVCGLLGEVLAEDSREAEQLVVLEVGAGNGMVGEELQGMGAPTIVGVDIIEEAAQAAERDRPGVYDDYVVADLTDLPPDARRQLEKTPFNCLVTVAALGFGDIPPEAFTAAYDLVETGSLVAFNIKEDFLSKRHESGFSALVRRSLEDGRMELKSQRRYQHRLSTTGEPLHYVAMVAEKKGDLAQL